MIAEVVGTGSVIVRGVDVRGRRPSAVGRLGTARSTHVRAMLREHDEWTFEVQVHTDDGGTPEQDRGALDRAGRRRSSSG